MEERTDCLSSDYLYQIIIVTVGGICVEVHSTHESQLLTAPVLGLLSLGRVGALELLATSRRQTNERAVRAENAKLLRTSIQAETTSVLACSLAVFNIAIAHLASERINIRFTL